MQGCEPSNGMQHMDPGDYDDLILPVPPEPFALIVGALAASVDSNAIEALMRRMGLQPEPLNDGEGNETVLLAPRFRLRFGGGVSVLAGTAAPSMLDFADPTDPATSLLAASLPPGWRAAGACWLFFPDRDNAAAGTASPVQMREFFKTTVLLIDMFDASHIFWSPARLWSDAVQFRASIAEMLASGMPPVLHLIAFRRREVDGVDSIGTRGLAHFTGQELEAPIPPAWTVADVVRRLSRLALDAMLNGPIRYPRTMRGLDAGERIGVLPPTGRAAPYAMVRVEFGRDA